MIVDGPSLVAYMIRKYEEVSTSQLLRELPGTNKSDVLFGMQLLQDGIEQAFSLQLRLGEVMWKDMSLNIIKHALSVGG